MRWARFALLALVPLLVGNVCGLEAKWHHKPPIRILVPADGQVVTWMPLTIELDARPLTDPGTLEVRLNGQDITAWFAVEPTVEGRVPIVADFVWESGLVLAETENLLEVSIVELQLGQTSTDGIRFHTTGDAFADDEVGLSLGTDGGFNAGLLPGIATGPPAGAGLFTGSTHVVSLGLGGVIDLEFVDNVIVDGPGVDFTVFENAFLAIGAGFITQPPFSEPGRVSVSQDGVSWYAFPCNLLIGEAPYHPGCAGVYPVIADGTDATAHGAVPSDVPIQDLVGVNGLTLAVPAGAGGDSFDLADVGLAWARYVSIESAPFVDGPSGAGTAGFDLDTVAAVNSVPATDADENGIPDAVE